MPKTASTKTTKTTAPEPEVDDPTAEAVVEIPCGDYTFTVPKSRDDWNTRAIMAFTRARTLPNQIDGIEQQLGPTQFRLLVDKAAPTAGAFRRFVDLFFETVKNECVD